MARSALQGGPPSSQPQAASYVHIVKPEMETRTLGMFGGASLQTTRWMGGGSKTRAPSPKEGPSRTWPRFASQGSGLDEDRRRHNCGGSASTRFGHWRRCHLPSSLVGPIPSQMLGDVPHPYSSASFNSVWSAFRRAGPPTAPTRTRKCRASQNCSHNSGSKCRAPPDSASSNNVSFKGSTSLGSTRQILYLSRGLPPSLSPFQPEPRPPLPDPSIPFTSPFPRKSPMPTIRSGRARMWSPPSTWYYAPHQLPPRRRVRACCEACLQRRPSQREHCIRRVRASPHASAGNLHACQGNLPRAQDRHVSRRRALHNLDRGRVSVHCSIEMRTHWRFSRLCALLQSMDVGIVGAPTYAKASFK